MPQDLTHGDLTNLVRIDQTGASVTALETRIGSWVDGRIARDELKQYSTQLRTIKDTFAFVIAALRESFKTVHPDLPRGDLYAACRLHDRRLLWIERLWTYFREKFDQRENPLYRDLLKAADEVVWSCYAEPFRRDGKTPASAPLPFIAAEYSPKAVPRREIPGDLKSDVDAAFLTEMLKQLPVPVIGLPPQCVSEPWWLIYLAHEVGHHVEFDLKVDEQLVDDFRDVLAAAAGEDGDRWRQWGEEIFADAFSLSMTGPWALWALGELEWTTAGGMLDTSDPRYPSAAVRLLLMRKLLDNMRLSGTDALRGFNPADLAAAGLSQFQLDRFNSDCGVSVPVSAAVLTAPLSDTRKTLPQLCDWSEQDHLGPRPRVTLWRDSLLGGLQMHPEQTLRAARTVIAAGVAAWARVSEERDPAKRAQAAQSLATTLLTTLRNSREPATRAAAIPGALVNTGKARLAALLLNTDPARLGAS